MVHFTTKVRFDMGRQTSGVIEPRMTPVDAVEIIFTGLLVLISMVIAWFAVFVVYKLYQGQA